MAMIALGVSGQMPSIQTGSNGAMTLSAHGFSFQVCQTLSPPRLPIPDPYVTRESGVMSVMSLMSPAISHLKLVASRLP